MELADQPPSGHRWLGGDIYSPPLPRGGRGFEASWLKGNRSVRSIIGIRAICVGVLVGLADHVIAS